MKENTCSECQHFLGCGDWNLCCDLPHPESTWGFLCYADTKACSKFQRRQIDTSPQNGSA